VPVDKFGRRNTAVQDNVSSVVSFTQMGDYFIRRDGSNTTIGSINMTGNTLMNVSKPVHDHDVANKLYVERRLGGTDKVSRSGDSIIIIIIIIIISTTMFMVLSSWQGHCESSPGSFHECRMAPSGRRPKTKPEDLGCESACTGCQKLHPPSPFIITQPES